MQEHVINGAADLARMLAELKPGADVQLGEILIQEKVITPEQLDAALELQQKESGRRLGKVLMEMGVATQEQINIALAHKFGIPYVKLKDFEISQEAISMIPVDVALQYNVLPLARVKGRLVVAMENPLDLEALNAIRFNTNQNVEPVITSALDISQALNKYYSKFDEVEVLEELQPAAVATEESNQATHLMEQQAMKKPIVRLLNAIILQAVIRNASDVNIRPAKDRVNVFYRIDGKLQFVRTLHKSLLPALVSRVKITGQMDIAERRLPQDGHARLIRGDNAIDLRLSVIPTVDGESVVIRILDKEVGLKPLKDIGFPPREMKILDELLARTFGIFLVTGPTGSGKSTTLYAVLNELKKRDPHIITVEDPVEYNMEGVEQIQISVAKGYTFAEALRHILRHDPDVIMIGEIRDLETAQIANKAALTGHLVLSTLHTNDAASAVTRLMDMGIEPYLLSSTLLGAMAQRLVRVNCPYCKAEEPVDLGMRELLGVKKSEVFYRGVGCPSCNYTGYHGRTTVCELLPVTPQLGGLINAGKSAMEIRQKALEEGMVPLTKHAIALARKGVTSLEEVLSVRLD